MKFIEIMTTKGLAELLHLNADWGLEIDWFGGETMKTAKLLIIVVGWTAAAGCTPKTSKYPKSQGAESGLTSINISMPDRRPLVGMAPQIETLMNGYTMLAELLTPGCQTSAQRIDEAGDYNQGVSQASLLQGCDYAITIAFGNKDPGARVLKATYLKNNAPFVIRKEDIAGKSTFPAVIPIQVQPEGVAIGLRAPQSSGTVPPATGGTVTPPPPPSAVNLSADKNLPLRGNNGQSSLSQVFKGDYLIVDLSAVSCGYCVERAKELESDRQLQQALNGTKCSRITMIDDLNGWAGLGFGPASFVGASTYEPGMSATAAGRRLGVQITGTPYYIILDRNGYVMPNSEVNSEPLQFIQSKCR